MQDKKLGFLSDELEEDISKLLAEYLVDINLPSVDVDILSVKHGQGFDDIEDDIAKAYVSYLLMKDTDMPREMIYSYVFKEGKKILWN